MRKFMLLFAVFLAAENVSAQREPFFNAVEVRSHLFFYEDLHWKKEDWLKLIAPSPFFSSFPDSLRLSKGTLFNQGGMGILAGPEKDLNAFSPNSRSALRWNASMGYRLLKISGTFTDFNGLSDTANNYQYETEYLTWKRHSIDVLNSLVYSFEVDRKDQIRFYAGMGLQASFLVKEKIYQAYNLFSYDYQQGKWQISLEAADEKYHDGPGGIVTSVVIPLGIEVKVLRKFNTRAGFDYVQSFFPSGMTRKNASAIQFAFGVSFDIK